ncbi:hypothetical protein ABPG72_014404 [Tetrahymena utriculariae]
MNENKSLECLLNVKGLKGNFRKGIYLNYFVVFDSIIMVRKGIIYAISWELNRIIIINIKSRKIIKQIQLQNVMEIRIITSRYSLLTTHNKILFVKDIDLNYELVSEIDIEYTKYSIFPLLKHMFCIYYKGSQQIQMYSQFDSVSSINVKHKQVVSMIWPLKMHPELIAIYDSQEIEVINWKLNQQIFKVDNLRVQNPKKSIMCCIDSSQYLISSQSGMNILNILEYDGYPKKEYWPRPCMNAQFISIILFNENYLIGSFLNEYQDYFLYVLEKESNQISLIQVVSDYYLIRINNKSFLATFSHYDSTKFLIWK